MAAHYRLVDFLTLVETPPIFTFGEVRRMLANLAESTPEDLAARVKTEISSESGLSPDRVSDLLKKLVYMRELVIDHAVSADSRDDVQDRLSSEIPISSVLQFLLGNLAVFKNRLAGQEVWTQLVEHIMRWAHFRRPGFYLPLRDREIGFLKASVKDIPGAVAAAFHEKATMLSSNTSRDIPTSTKGAFQDIANQIEVAIAGAAIERFKRRGGISALWGDTPHGAERDVIFNSQSAFNRGAHRTQLEAVTELAQTDEAIHGNFVEFLRILMYGASGGSEHLSKLQCEELVRDEGYFERIWAAAVAQPLNPRMVGSMRTALKKLTGLGVTEYPLQRPECGKTSSVSSSQKKRILWLLGLTATNCGLTESPCNKASS